MNGAMRKGGVVAVLLAVFTILEYIFAVNVGDDVVRFLSLAATALAKAGLIGWYFMHFYRMWRTEEAEAWH